MEHLAAIDLCCFPLEFQETTGMMTETEYWTCFHQVDTNVININVLTFTPICKHLSADDLYFSFAPHCPKWPKIIWSRFEGTAGAFTLFPLNNKLLMMNEFMHT